MEHYCGMLKPAIRSRRFPFATLAHYVLDTARLSQVKLIYNAGEALSLRAPHKDSATVFPGCEYNDWPVHCMLTIIHTRLDVCSTSSIQTWRSS